MSSYGDYLSAFNALCDPLLFCLVDLLMSSIIVLLDPLILLSPHDKTGIRHCNLLLLFMVVSFHLISVWRYLCHYVCLHASLLSRDLISVGYHDWSCDWSSFDCPVLPGLGQTPLTCMMPALSVLSLICMMTALSVLLCYHVLTHSCVVLPCLDWATLLMIAPNRSELLWSSRTTASVLLCCGSCM